MAGHSKWSSIKRKKAATDAKRGKLFTKLIREITVAARAGGGDPAGNPRLRAAIANARSASMSNENIDRAVKRGSSNSDSADYEEIAYEGYAPGGVAIIAEALTDNRNRTVAEIRSIFSKAGGSLGATGSVGWIFKRKGIVLIDSSDRNEEELIEDALDAGATDIEEDSDNFFQIETEPESLYAIREKLEAKNYPIESAELKLIAETTVKIDNESDARKIINLIENLEEQDDTRAVHSNLDFDAIADMIE